MKRATKETQSNRTRRWVEPFTNSITAEREKRENTRLEEEGMEREEESSHRRESNRSDACLVSREGFVGVDVSFDSFSSTQP